MANKIVQAIYDLKDNITAKLKTISDSWKGAGDAADKAASRAESSNKRLSDSFKQSSEGAKQLREALALLAGFVGVEKVTEGLKEIIDVGEEADDRIKKLATAFGGLDAGQKAFEQIYAIAQNVPNSFEDVTNAAIALKKAGIDPLDGSLQALLDNAAANNQSQEQLMKTIEDLGKASVKGGVNLKTLVALTEDGIPAFELLGKSLGVSADRVRELASTGKLGSDSIKTLISSLGNLRAGAAADELGDFDSQITKLKDSVKEFLEQIAASGALQVFRDGIKSLNAEVEEAAKSGRLKEIAQSVSDAIVSTANAVKSAVGFVVDYAGALKRLAAAYVTVKAINISTSVLAGAAAMLKAGEATSKAAGEAEKASGIFGKLGSFIKGIPSLLKISVIAIGLDFVLEGLTNLISARKEQVKLEHDTRDAALANVDANNKLQVAIEKIKVAYKQYADVAIESNDQLKQQSADQLKAYEKQLEGARTFYNALAVQAAQAGDKLGLADANVHLAALNKEIQAVNTQLAITQNVGTNVAKGLTKGAQEFLTVLADLGSDSKAIGDQIAKSFDGFDLKKQVTEVGDFAVALDTIAAKGGKTAEILDSTLLESLKKLSGKDLLQFQSNAIASIKDLGDKALLTSEVLKATLEAALDRLGVKAQDTGAKITRSGADIIAAFTAVGENVQATSRTIAAAFDSAINSAKTVEELSALRNELATLAAQGKVSFRDLSVATAEYDERLRTVTASVSRLASQYELLGIKSQAQLNAMRDNAKEAFDEIVTGASKGEAAQEDVIRAFKAYVDAARAASADSSQSAKDQVDEQLSVLASVNNLTDQFDKMGEAGKAAAEKTAHSFRDAQDSIADTAKAAAQETDDFAQRGSDALAIITQALANTRSEFLAISDAAASAFDTHLVEDFAVTFDSTGAGFSRVLDAMSSAAAEVNTQIANQREQLKGEIEQINKLGTDSADGFGAFGRNADAAALKMQGLADIIAQGKYDAGLLGQEDLAPLQQALEQAADRTRQLADEAKQAKQAYDDLSASIQDQLDEAEGNQAGIEERRHEKALQNLQDEAKAAGQLNSAQYNQDVANENKLHQLKLKNLKDQDKGSGGNGGGDASPTGGGVGGGGNGSGSGTSGAGIGGPTVNVTVHVAQGGTVIGGTKKDIATALGPEIANALKAIQSNARVNIFTGKP
jgi:tape measure domain-containing protein